MSLKWSDPRYAWDPVDYEGLTSVPLPFSAAWAPEVILHNALEEKFMYRQVGVVRHNGDLIYLVSIHTKSGCRPNFEDGDFPFNVQTCRLKFGSWVNGQYKVEYRVSAGGVNQSNVNLSEFTSPTGWKILATEASLESSQYPLFEEPSHSVVFTFSFKRSVFYDPISGSILWKVSILKSLLMLSKNVFNCSKM
jgi:nicotinic acetylcholine receptor alpha-7